MTSLIDLCLSAPTGVLMLLKELEELGYDFASVIGPDIDRQQLLQLRDATHLCRCIDLPLEVKIEKNKGAD